MGVANTGRRQIEAVTGFLYMPEDELCVEILRRKTPYRFTS